MGFRVQPEIPSGVQVAWAAARLGVFDVHAARALSAAAADPTALRAQERLSGCEAKQQRNVGVHAYQRNRTKTQQYILEG